MSIPKVRQAIEHLSAAICADPMKARAKNVPATARLTEGLRCELTGPYNERLVTDMAPAMGGTATGPNPGWLLRGALASCTATVIAMRAAQLGVALSNLEVTVETDSDPRHPRTRRERFCRPRPGAHESIHQRTQRVSGCAARDRDLGRPPLAGHLHHEAGAGMLTRGPGRLT
jgi:uncharacterized OsmC-like protein